MKRRALSLLALSLLLSACGRALPTLPVPPELGWQAYPEAQVSIRLPTSWRVVDAAHPVDPVDIERRKAAGDPLGTYLETMSHSVKSGLYLLQAVDPSTVSPAISFAVSSYLAYVPDILAPSPTSAPSASASPPTAEELLARNLEATKALYQLTALPSAKEVTPPRGFARGWEIEYVWEATQNTTGAKAQLAGLHYLFLRGSDAWIVGFTALRTAAPGALDTWRLVAGGLVAPALPLDLSAWLSFWPLLVVGFLLLLVAAIGFSRWRQRRRRAEEARLRHRRRGHHTR